MRRTITDARRASNRRSGKRSTGPRSARGKATASLNAVKHGAFARVAPLYDEDDKKFAAFLSRLDDALLPRDEMDAVLVEKIALALWRLRRLRRYERALQAEDLQRFLNSEAVRERKGKLDARLKLHKDTRGFPDAEKLSYLLRYAAALEREWIRCYILFQQRREP